MAAAVALAIGSLALPIGSNTMFVHLRTGIDMVDAGAIPRADPYSFTATGHEWIVQSWFAEWTYGLLHVVGGYHAVILECMLVGAATAVVVVSLGRGGTMLRTAAGCLPVIVVLMNEWSQRPALFALLCFGLTILIVERRHQWWLLVPVFWLWINTHGSFVFGIAWVLLVLLSERLWGSGAWRRGSWRGYWRYVGGCALGVAVGALNPLGPKLLLFWTSAIGDRHQVFEAIKEWGPPDFHSSSGLLELAMIVVMLVLLVGARAPLRRAVPGLVFLAAGLYASRNVAFAAVALTPALGLAVRSGRVLTASAQPELTQPELTQSDLPVSHPSYLARIGLVVVCLAVVGSVARVSTQPALDFEDYPVAAINWMDGRGLLDEPHRVIAPDIVGCYRILRDGVTRKVFIDDRYDMYPVAVAQDSLSLLHMTGSPVTIADRYSADVVLWPVGKALAYYLEDNASFRRVWSDGEWIVYQRDR